MHNKIITLLKEFDCYIIYMNNKYDDDFKIVFYITIYLNIINIIICKISYMMLNNRTALLVDEFCAIIFIFWILYINIKVFIKKVVENAKDKSL